MPDLDDMGAVSEAAAVSHGTAAAAAPPSQRSVLRVAAGAGAAGIAASTLGSVVGGVAARASTKAGPHASHEAGAAGATAGAEPLVLHVRDAASGEIDVFRGTTLTRVHDKDLAARIVSASR